MADAAVPRPSSSSEPPPAADRPRSVSTEIPRAETALVRSIQQQHQALSSRSDRQLREEADQLRDAVRQGRSVISREILVRSFALAAESCVRTLKMQPYDVQLYAGIVLARGGIAEMKTGEGKTLSAVAPAFTRSLTGRGVHVATVNQYLAERDFEQLQPAFELLGTSVDVLRPREPDTKPGAYACDVTYGAGYEFGFDYLRDQVALLRSRESHLGERFRQAIRGRQSVARERLQRHHAFAIVDEIDSILLDEARTPLVLSDAPESAEEDPTAYHEARRLAESLVEHDDYRLDQTKRTVELTESGLATAEAVWGRIPDVTLRRPWSLYVEQALHAAHFLKRDRDYIIRDGAVHIVDESTGRIFSDRSWRDGLHQAVEAREQLTVTAEKQSLARISRQRYFQFYEQFAGMTGTATGSEREFQRLYRLSVVPIPLYRPDRRETLPTRYFKDQESKWRAIADEVQCRHRTGQPILVGTRHIAASESLAEELQRREITFRLLNGKQDEDEARIVADAGRRGNITIATNMAGRGTDIQPTRDSLQAGGLHVLGTERHESSRIDRQLAGRSARQGDPGSCQFFVALDDHLLKLHGRGVRRYARQADPHGEIHEDLAALVTRAQQRAERHAYQQRRRLLQHDAWREKVLEATAREESTPD